MSKLKLTDEQYQKMLKEKLDYKKADMFLHCEHCLKEYTESEVRMTKSPRDAMSYEMSSYPFTYPDGTTARIMVGWCKKCGRRVWDSRHLIPID